MSDTPPPSPAAQPLTTEAERLRALFQAAVVRELPTMTSSARLILRAWAEAELAIQAARRSQEPGAADLLSAEEFRVRPFLPVEEVSRERIVRWCSINRQPLDEEKNDRVARYDGGWYVMHPGGEYPDRYGQVFYYASFEKITRLESQARLDVPLFIDSLSVPAAIAGGNVGWEPIKYLGPVEVLAQLDKLEAGYVEYPAERERTVEYILQGYHNPPASTGPVNGVA